MNLVNTKEAISLLNEGQLVAIPTETVYGLAGKIEFEETVKNIFYTKKRPFFDPLIVHISNIKQTKELVNLTQKEGEVFEELNRQFWPGPLSIVLKASKKLSPLINAHLSYVGIRCPNHPMSLKVIEQTGPLAAPSANYFGHLSPVKAKDVCLEFENTIPVLDGGVCEVGIESTVLSIEEKSQMIYLSILRKGLISKKQITESLEGFSFQWFKSNLKSPGQLKNHYQPKKPLFIFENKKKEEQINEIQKKLKLNQEPSIAYLKFDKDPYLSARNLYSQMRQLSLSHDVLIAEKSNSHKNELWDSIWDRIQKASFKN